MKILFENRKKDDVGNDALTQLDATDCETTNQGKSKKAFYSFKFRHNGLRYEIGINIRTGDIVWIMGPWPCGDWPDVECLRSDLKHHLEEDERLETDDGYIGEDPCITLCPAGVRAMESDSWHKKRGEVRSRGETANHRLKTYKVLGGKFRHDLEKHSMCFRACAVLTQLSFEYGSKSLFSVSNYNQYDDEESSSDEDGDVV